MALTILANIDLDDAATGVQTGTIGEPTAAAAGKTVFVTGNWFASVSKDSGASWTLVDPFTELPTAAGGFCCDQLSLYSRTQKLWIWILQYSSKNDSNVLRLAVSKTAEPGSWHWFDFSPALLNAGWSNLWFDYPDIAESDGAIWLTSNMYDANNDWKRAVALKIDSTTIGPGSTLSYSFWTSTQVGSLRLAQGAGNTMYFGAQRSSTELRVFEWPDASQTVSQWDVAVNAWARGPYVSTDPGGRRWLSRCDDRITGAWLAGNQLGFLWTSSAIPGRPHPFVRAVRVNVKTRKRIDEPDLWSPDHALAYPAAAPNSNGHIGITAFVGGGNLHPSHLVGVRNDAAGTWETQVARIGTHGPADHKWGDYLTVRRHGSVPTTWIASGYTLQGGSSRVHVEPRVVRFRR